MFNYRWKNQAQLYFIAIHRIRIQDPKKKKNVPFIFEAKMEIPRSQTM